MASSSISWAVIAMVLVLLPFSSMGLWDDLAPTIGAELCEEMECGKGTCKVDGSSPIGFICECEANWKRTQDDEDDDDLRFLPCVIPNCSLKYDGCQPAPPPVPEKEVPRNISAFDPCYWAYCGEGKCTKNNTVSHSHVCECNSGFFNLLNVTAFPCYSECTLGSDCESLGIKVANSNSGSESYAASFLPGKFQWMMALMMSVAIILQK
ncbi:uncharacterized protein LOC107412210 [Ziziphus jujuba]|uniref:Uncharacterized protein LOC107412210 n=2 Tax=Ziziphus jujuba TaxID=326968 RepID=A0A6P3ZJZ1_ZIZJJ|nr:uncharacterized protein LOC107412210 [Ziziphus jujuba]KAH7543230.1 hypothetical protein FEM48_Zijuj02G0162200 [Ziziphus jujuba var. spinosa]